MFRCMTYHVYQQDTDVSGIIKVTTLWELVSWHNENLRQEMYSSSEDSYPPSQTDPMIPLNISNGLFGHRRNINSNSGDELKQILESYVSRSSPALHMYSGMLDSRFVMNIEIQKFLEGTISKAFPWKLQIESLDSAILFYSLALCCLGFLFYTIYSKLMTQQSKDDTPLHECLHGDLLLFDSLYWVTQFLFNFIVLDIASAVTIPILSAWQSLQYVLLLYVVCSPTHLPKHVKIIVMISWAAHVMLQSKFSHSGVGSGGIILICHIINVIFCYITLVEAIDVPKFLNLRVWSSVFSNSIFLFIYLNSVEYISSYV